MALKPEPLFYIERDEQNVAGPYDLVQLAGLLRKKIITPETPTRLEGEDAWKPFSWQPQFIVVREIPPDAVSTRVDDLNEAAAAKASGPIPLPSRENVLRLAGMILGSLLAGAGSYAIARLDVATGYCLLYAGAGVALVAHCLILAQLLDENVWTLGLVFLVPGGDTYYFITRFWQYFKWVCLECVGAAVWAGAAMGLAAHGASP